MMIVGRVALLGLDAALPDARGHGCQSALLTRRVVEARNAGCDTIVAEACEDHPAGGAAARNLLRLGFEEIPGKVNWRRPSGIA
jgi:GNAT superfamily N-acetyltransferase